ncbi:deoxyribose-phosphate aldolase [Methanobacterium alcaliphilum]|uniref:deoxyribose-phosphate aldolase n=1 Tax=Methanobacterium alcaliphilum TaxID=392018 RepID=UPI003183A483
MEDLAKMIDHTNVKGDVTEEDVRQLCREAVQYGFGCAVVTPTNVSLAHEILQDTPVKVCSVIGFPLGINTPATKAFETKEAIKNGAEEIDMVMNIGALKSKNEEKFRDDIESVVSSSENANVKVILETALLTDKEKVKSCQIAKQIGVDYVKTSTAYGGLSGATVEDVILMKQTVGDNIGVKAAGGIRDLKTTLSMIEAGADKIGTSTGVNIIQEMIKQLK